ncbi:MAG: transposase [Oscillibacter sp.]|nr:transposase [Oscillibacter sp.]
MPKGVPNKRYTPEFKEMVIETMLQEKLSYRETARRFETEDKRIVAWERIYLEEGPEGFSVERRGRGSKGRLRKGLKPEVEKDLLAEVQRLRAENDYLKKFQALVLENERRQRRKRR